MKFVEEIKFDEALSAAMARYDKAEDAYLKKFGAGSLDRVTIIEPMWFDSGNFNRGAEELERAIRRNRPIKQIPEEIWKQLRF